MRALLVARKGIVLTSQITQERCVCDAIDGLDRYTIHGMQLAAVKCPRGRFQEA